MSANWSSFFLSCLCISGCTTPQDNRSCATGYAEFSRVQSERNTVTLRVQSSGSHKAVLLPSVDVNFMNGAETRTTCLSEEGVAAFNEPRVGTDQLFFGILGMQVLLQVEKLSSSNKSLEPITPVIDPICEAKARQDYETEICTRFPFLGKCVANSGISELAIGSDAQDRAEYALQIEGGQRVAQFYKHCLQIKANG